MRKARWQTDNRYSNDGRHFFWSKFICRWSQLPMFMTFCFEYVVGAVDSHWRRCRLWFVVAVFDILHSIEYVTAMQNTYSMKGIDISIFAYLTVIQSIYCILNLRSVPWHTILAIYEATTFYFILLHFHSSYKPKILIISTFSSVDNTVFLFACGISLISLLNVSILKLIYFWSVWYFKHVVQWHEIYSLIFMEKLCALSEFRSDQVIILVALEEY